MRKTSRTSKFLLLSVVIAVAFACSEGRAPRGRVLLVGIDGAAPRLIGPWMDEGLLPNLAALAHNGVWGKLRSHHPLLSPRIWTSVATGKLPEQHGIESWLRPTEERRLRLFRSDDRRCHAIWNILSHENLKVGVVNWLITYPPEKVNGVMISDFAIPGEREGHEQEGEDLARSFGQPGIVRSNAQTDVITTFPTEWLARFTRIWSSAAPLEGVSDPTEPFRSEPIMKKILSRAWRTDDLALRAALEVDRVLRPDLLMVWLPGIDRISHFFWAGVERPELYPESIRPTPKQRAEWRQSLRTYYAYTDELIGLLTSGFSQEDLILVVSDHGFEAYTGGGGKTGNHTSLVAENAIVFARGPGIPSGEAVEGMSVNDVTPTILAWLGLPIAEDMDGEPAGFLEVRSPRVIATYDRGSIERIDTRADQLEQTVIEELRSLGYVD
jgi:predicted AlkP superfamily phosphohydrolase/phosphomutase